jgi:metal-sulfur cluster biosynthetic enzyme
MMDKMKDKKKKEKADKKKEKAGNDELISNKSFELQDQSNKELKERIIEKLKQVKDPEFSVDIVNLGLIYDIKIEGNKAFIKMTLTTPTCPFAANILRDTQKVLSEINELDEIFVEVVFDPPWSADMMSEEAKLMLGFEG